MPKVGMEPIRRRQLIAATIEAIHQAGFAQTTIAEISRRAGLSSGIVAHYFQDKAGLLEATLRSLAEDLRRGVVAHLGPATSADVADADDVVGARFSRRGQGAGRYEIRGGQRAACQRRAAGDESSSGNFTWVRHGKLSYS